MRPKATVSNDVNLNEMNVGALNYKTAWWGSCVSVENVNPTLRNGIGELLSYRRNTQVKKSY